MDNIREKLLDLIIEAKKADTEDAPFSEFLADFLVGYGVTVLPCKLGDTVWGIKKCNKGYAVKQGVAYQMYFGENMRLCICVKNVCRGEWGANVFATQKEAEQALLTPPKGE